MSGEVLVTDRKFHVVRGDFELEYWCGYWTRFRSAATEYSEADAMRIVDQMQADGKVAWTQRCR